MVSTVIHNLYIFLSMIFSGGTIAGLSLGSSLSNLGAKVNTKYLFLSPDLSSSLFLKTALYLHSSCMQVHAYCVCDDPEYFYEYAQGLLDGMQAGVSSRDIVNIENVSSMFVVLSRNFLIFE